MNEELATVVKTIIANQAGAALSSLNDLDETFDNLKLDCLDRIEIAMSIEDHYDDVFKIEDEDLARCNTLGDLIRLVGDKLS